MGKKVGYNKRGVTFVFTDGNVDNFTVFFADYAVKSKGDCSPLILFDTAVVVSFEKSKLAVFIKRICLFAEMFFYIFSDFKNRFLSFFR